jgi:hypothetical protein
MRAAALEFLLADGEELDALWPEIATQEGLLLCSRIHAGACDLRHGCGVGTQAIRFNVMPIIGVDGFDCDRFRRVYVVHPAKKYMNVDAEIARAVIQPFLARLREHGPLILESRLVNEHRQWVDLA